MPDPSVQNLNKSQKFVRLIEWMQRHDGVGVDDVMAVMDLDRRTLRRYLADLRGLGLPVVDKGRGRRRRLSLAPSYGRQGVQLTLLELVSLRFGRTLFDFLQGTQFASDLDDALERLSAGFGRLDPRLSTDMDRKFLAVAEHRKDHKRSSELLDDMLTALLYNVPVQATYARIGQPSKDYKLHPYTLATYRQSLYLFALDVDAGVVKTFAIDRFQSFQRLRGERFELPHDYDPRDQVADAFGISGGTPREVILHFSKDTAPYIRERIWHDTQSVTPSGDGGVVLRMHVAIGPELTSWILGFGPDVRVLAPADLGEQIRQLHFEAAE